MDDAPVSRMETWRARFQHLRVYARKTLPFVTGMGAMLLALVVYNRLFPAPAPLSTADVENTVALMMASATPPPAFSQRVYQQIQPSLVLIETTDLNEAGEDEGGLGTGVIIDFSGDILTSLHVVDGADEILLTFVDGTQSAAEIALTQPENDIAVVRTLDPPPPFPPAVMGNPASLQVGDEAFVVGNPFGLYSSMSAGVISGFERTFLMPNSEQRLTGLIQIDAAVNPGNSGGPLLNRDGYVVGIVTGLVNPTEENFFIGIAFAVPIDVAAAAAGAPQH
ncbi:MAG TPA: trypsin-like peptidase domain-containing protein [Anaerolineales bacterium]|nr:trypsin-like peptidase domain-containing protein [Anaerolineales bacterium]